MKPILLILLAAGMTCLGAPGPGDGTSTNAVPETHITSDSVNFDLQTRTAIYRGKVRVEDPRVAMTCELLTATIPEHSGRVDRIVAETNVVIVLVDKGTTNRATSAKAVYTYSVEAGRTNEVIELLGSPAIESPQGTLTGDSIVWDRSNDSIKATNQRMTVHQDDSNATNAMPRLQL
jgi:lipopolysaccharide transport protein LptA